MNILEHNSAAWDKYVEGGIEWSIPFGEDAIAAARRGGIGVWLTDKTPVPSEWLEGVSGEKELQRRLNEREAFEFGHTLTGQIGGQIAAGSVITGFYEDKRIQNEHNRDDPELLLSKYTPVYIATRALKQA